MFQRWRNTVTRFMTGRYGLDSLGWFLLIVYGVLCVVGWFFPTRSVPLRILGGVALVLLVLCFGRVFSRRIGQRQAENERYLRCRYAVRSWFRRQSDRVRYIRQYRFRRCPYCKAQLRLPIRRGRRTVTCPCCHSQFHSLFL